MPLRISKEQFLITLLELFSYSINLFYYNIILFITYLTG
jgi:hypothetical protein